MRPLLQGILWLLLGMGIPVPGSAQAPPERVTLQLKWHHQFQFAGYYAAQQQGYYREAGLEVDIHEGQPGIDVVKEVAGGHAQFGVGTSALLLARNQGQPVVILAAIFQHSPVILVARTGAGISSVQDLPGKRLMIEQQSDDLIAYMRKEGVSERSVTMLPHTFNPEDLIQGKVDCISAYLTDEPYFFDKVRFPYLIFTPRMGGIDFYGDNLFTSDEELKLHPERVKAFREASLRGWKYAMQHPEEIADLIIARYGEGRGREYLLYEAQKMAMLMQPTLVDMGYMYRGRWQHIRDTYVELGLLPKGFDLDKVLYEPEAGARQINRRLAVATAVLLGVGLALASATLFFSRLYLRLKREIASREEAERAVRLQQEQKLQLEMELQQARKMESLGNLAGGVAHDMNNVLGAILGIASASLEAHPEDSATHRAFETITRAAERGGKMVKSLLSFARQSPTEQREVNLNQILREETELLARTTLSRIRLEMDLDPALKPVLGDASALTQVFMNLCVNAVDAMPSQGTLTLRTRNLGADWIEASVEDTGTGMPKEVLDKAMEPFFTTKEVGKGTGLGLSMVYSIVKAHHGQVELDSDLGRGTRVTLRFPACEPEVRPSEPPTGSRTAPAQRILQVLLVDDDELVLSSVESVLHSLGHIVVTAGSGEVALERIEGGFEPDVVILDLNMPGLGGGGTLPQLRALLPAVPVLLSTGRADQAAQALVKAHPPITLLPKPFSIQNLREHLGATDLGA
ncbi:MAG TPA: ABC transporter substrate-binding protein [Geothrix sp.]|nr:ABC transporter substrate-binding protein [Geothrix sp.]